MTVAKKWQETFLIVEGSCRFPVDMLRYSTCVPAREVDSNVIGREWPVDRGIVRRVILRRFSGDGMAASRPNTHSPRWKSFGWDVVDHVSSVDLALRIVEKLEQEDAGDGTSGQDRESYSDDQDRKSYR